MLPEKFDGWLILIIFWMTCFIFSKSFNIPLLFLVSCNFLNSWSGCGVGKSSPEISWNHASSPTADRCCPAGWRGDPERLRKCIFLPVQGDEKPSPLHTYNSIRIRSVINKHLGNKLICVFVSVCVWDRDRQKGFKYTYFLLKDLKCLLIEWEWVMCN